MTESQKDAVTRHEFETSIKQIWEGIKSLGDAIKVESQSRKQDYLLLGAKIDHLGETFSKSRELKVGQIAAVTGVVVAILVAIFGGIGSGYVRDQDKLSRQLSDLELRTRDEHSMIDEKVRREVTLSSERTTGAIGDLRTRLQLEINGLNAIQDKGQAQDRREIDALKEWQTYFVNSYPPKWLIDDVKSNKEAVDNLINSNTNSAQDERLKNLEREVFQNHQEK